MVACKRCILIFITGAAGYCIIEILWRGYTHPSMAVVGGVCFLAICFLNKKFCHKPRMVRAVFCAASISVIELLSGFLLNIAMKLNVWDYSGRPFNLMGQICLLYSLLWLLLSYAVLFVLDRWPCKK